MIEHHQPIILIGEFQHGGYYLYDSLMFSGAGAGLGLRDKVIQDGKVSVNGTITTDVGHIVNSDDLVCFYNQCYLVIK